MKNIFLIGLLIIFSCPSVKIKNDASIEFGNTEYNFGALSVNKETEHNTGSPVMIYIKGQVEYPENLKEPTE